MHTFVISGLVYVSQSHAMPPGPLSPPDFDVLSDSYELRRMQVEYPHLPYSAPTIHSGPLFSCLNLKRNQIPIIRHNSSYELRPDIRSQLRDLDFFLTAVVGYLRSKITIFPMGTELQPVPSTYPYMRPHFSEEGVRTATFKALKAFQHLMTICSFAMSYFDDLDKPETGWTRLLLQRQLPFVKVQQLRDSTVGQFSPSSRRVGTVVFAVDESCLPFVERMVTAHVPVWVCWGSCSPSGERYFRPLRNVAGAQYINTNFYPSDEDLNAAIQVALRSVSSRPASLVPLPFTDAPVNSSSSALPRHALPIPDPVSRQRLGETWQEFFVRENVRHMKLQAREQPKDTAARKQRLQHSLKFTVPSARGAKVYQWEVDDKTQLRVRTPISVGTAEMIWSLYSESQLRYNAYDNEWDICTEFDLDAPVPDDPFNDFEDDGDDPVGPVIPRRPATARPVSSSSPKPSSSTTVVPPLFSIAAPPTAPSGPSVIVGAEEISDCSPSTTTEPLLSSATPPPDPVPTPGPPVSIGGETTGNPPSTTFPPLEDILYQRYGFLGSSDTLSQPTSSSSDELGVLSKKVCESSAPRPQSTSMRSAISCFLHLSLKSNEGSSISLVDKHRDLGHPQDLADQYSSCRITVERRRGHYIPHNGLPVEDIFYLIRPHNTVHAPTHFVIVLSDPVAVLQVIRMNWGPSPPDIASALMLAGIPFNTRILDAAVPHAVRPRRPMLGFLPFNYRISPSDFTAYIDHRDDYLQRHHLRAALMKGGIIARLAREALGNLGEEIVRRGPSDEFVKFGSPVKFNDEYYWDDDLTKDEEEMICGVYKLSTGQRSTFGEQLSDVSWWPKQSTWELSGLNVGYWSSDDETWYQKRLEEIRNFQVGNKILWSATEWRNKLKYHKETKKIVQANRKAAAAWVESL